MASLEFCSKHNMVAYLEKTDGNTEFHQIMDFLTRSSIYYALTVSPIVSTSFVEQCWTTAKYRTVNNISYIDATVAGKPVTISEASIRSDLLFDDVDGIDSLNNEAIFENIQLMGNQLKDVHVPLDHFPVPTLTKKVLTFMVKKGKNFSRKVTTLFDSMLVQQTEDEGEALERPTDSQPIPSPPHPSEDQPQTQTDPSLSLSPSIANIDSNPEGSGENHGAQAKEIKALKAQVKKLKKGVKPLITHHKAWMKSVALKTRLARKTSLKKKGVQKGYVSKQGRKSVKSFKGEPSVHKDPNFEDLDDFVDVDDTLDYMETEDDQDEGRTSSVVLEEKESADKEVSTEAPVSTVKPNEGTDKRNEGTDKQDGGTDSTKDSTDRQGEGTADQNEGKSATQTAPTIFGDDETIAQVLITMSQNKQKEKEKGVEIRNVEDTERPRPTSTRYVLTLKPLPKIDPKDKGKKMIDEEGESDTESDDITEAEKKFKMLAKDEEVARKVQEEWEAEEEKKRLAEEEATKDERQIKELNKDPKKKRVIKETPKGEDTAKVLAEQEVTEQGTKKIKSGHVKMIARKRPRPQPDDDSDDEHRKCLRIITFESTIDSEIMETKSFIARLHKVSSPDGNYLVVYRVNGHFRAFNYLMEGDLKIMMESSTEENDQELKDGTVIYMLVKIRYPLSKELLQQMIDLGLEVEEESTAALQLVRFFKQQLNEE
ncbi:hypothetical protein Tco_0953860 [Tanacetum coccineum]|uniref:Xylulose kinase-1 n=1 Tax=Tanacetum coccineum TaxID=301880 RepID=A0ABQ5E151_9ASTR